MLGNTPNLASSDSFKLDDETPETSSRGTAHENALGMYFEGLAADRVLTPDEEVEVAQRIEHCDIDLWVQLLSHAPAIDTMLSVLESTMENALPEFGPLREAADAVRRKRTKAALRRLDSCARDVAEKLRTLDQDKVHITALVAELAAFERSGFGRIRRVEPPFPTKGRPFSDYLARVRDAQEQAIEARNAFVRANLRLVISIARRYSKGPMSLADLIQEGNLGLLKAVERFDHRRGFRFSTYASWWIRHAVGRALADKGREVRIPVHMVDATYKIRRATHDLHGKLGREPTREEIAKAVDMEPKKLEQLSTYLIGAPVSLDQPMGGEDPRPLHEMFADDSEDEPLVDRMAKTDLEKALGTVLHQLSDVEIDVIRRRFGLGTEREHTLQEIADGYERSRERIRQIQARALDKLRRALVRAGAA